MLLESLRTWLEPDPAFRWTRWLLVRLIGLCFFSAFLALVFQMEGLIGPMGILPAHDYLNVLAQHFGPWQRWWLTPTLLWLGSGTLAIHLVAWTGLLASVLLVVNLLPRAMAGVCLVCFVSFLAAAQDFASYQSDGMIMAAGLICLFLAPQLSRRWRWWPAPGDAGPIRLSLFALRWLWFTIYFDSGVVKIASHDPQWRHLTAMDHYYEYGPLPTWIGWYAQKLPHGFHAATVVATLAIELGIVWLAFMPRRGRIICFWIVTPLQIGIIFTANYGFLNYLVLALGFALVDDRHWRWLAGRLRLRRRRAAAPAATPETTPAANAVRLGPGAVVTAAVLLSWIFITGCETGDLMFPAVPWPRVEALEPFRIADSYGLFAVMTTDRFEIEFQGSDDGTTWRSYPFRFKPQDPSQAPGIYAPYQPRFDWNLWFASLGTWREYQFVLNTEVRLLQGSAPVLALFAGNPFPAHPPNQVRAVIWQYHFSTRAEKRSQGVWWVRRYLGLYAPALRRDPNGQIVVTEFPPTVRFEP